MSESPRTQWLSLHAAHAHLVGIGGSGMRSLARLLDQLGWTISGSDTATEGLSAVLPLGARLTTGHDAAALPDRTALVVHSDAVGPDNVEIREARSRGIEVLSYFDVLGRLMRMRRGLAVAGTHGKSTTTAMAAWILTESGHDPTVAFGAAALGQPDGGRSGNGPLMLVEACEYRANFLKLRPQTAVLLGIEPDHFDCYPTLDAAERAYAQFAQSVDADGLILARGECSATRRAVASASCRVEMFGLDASFDWSAQRLEHQAGRYTFDLIHDGRRLARVELRMPGRHNMVNALAAAALTWHEGVEPDQLAYLLSTFPGVSRRLEVVGERQGVCLMDDYAHHPTELTATLRAVREMHPDRRICCAFQPHQASRTARLLDEWVESLHNGLRGDDRLWVADIFRAREPSPAPGEPTAADLANRVRQTGHDVARVHRIEAIVDDLTNHLRPGDVLITIGAGDIRRALDQVRRGGLSNTKAINSIPIQDYS